MSENSPFDWTRFRACPVVGILRGFTQPDSLAAVMAAERGGLGNVEVTMNTIDACTQITALRDHFGERMNVGAGTVCTCSELDAAVSAGAQFVITPVVVPDVIRRCRELQIPVACGALTPTEVWQAAAAGADWVKVFPASRFGSDYIRELAGPLDGVRLMPTGGVTVDNAAAYVAAGAVALGVGSPLFAQDRINAADWEWVEQQARRFKQAVGGNASTN